MSRKDYFILFTLALVQFTHVMDFMIIMPMGNQLMQLFAIGPAKFGQIVSSYNIAAGVVGFAGAFFVDRLDRKRLLTWAYAGFLLGTLACAFAPDYELMLASRILTGAFGGLLSSVIFSIISDHFALDRRASAMGIVTSGFALASVFGVPFGSFLASEFSWHAPFLFIAAVGVFIIGGIFAFIPVMRAHLSDSAARPNPVAVIKNLAANKNQQRALLLMSLLMFSQFSIIPFIAPYMETNVGFTRNEVNLIYLFGGLCAVFTAPLTGKLADRIGRQKVFRIFGILLIVPVLLITHMGAWPVWLALIVTSVLFITINGRVVPAMAIISSTTEPKTRGSFMSFNSSVQQISSGIAASIAGALVTRNELGQLEHYNWVGYIAIVAGVLALIAAVRVKAAD